MNIKIVDNSRYYALFRALFLWLDELFPEVILVAGFPQLVLDKKVMYRRFYDTRPDSVTLLLRGGVNQEFFKRVVSPVLLRDYGVLKLLCRYVPARGVVLLNTKLINPIGHVHDSCMLAALQCAAGRNELLLYRARLSI